MCRYLYRSFAKRRGAISIQRMSIRMPFFLLPSFVEGIVCRSGKVTRERLRRYEQHLYECGLRPNTISTYMRMLRSVYNRGVEAAVRLMSRICFATFDAVYCCPDVPVLRDVFR